MRIAIHCEFEEETANGILMKGRALALSRLTHSVTLIYQPFKFTISVRNKDCLPNDYLTIKTLKSSFFRKKGVLRLLMLPFLLIDCLSAFVNLRFSNTVILHKALPFSLLYALLLRISLYRGRIITIIDDWEGIGGFASIRNSNNVWNRLLVTTTEEVLPLFSDKIVCVSKILFDKMQLSDQTKHKSTYIPNGGQKLDQTHKIETNKSNRIVVGYIGTFKSKKLIDLLLEIAQTTTKERNNIDFIFVGGGELHDHLKSLMAKLSLGNRLILTGQVHSDEVIKYLNKMHICLVVLFEDFPDTFIDASRSSTKMFEYMASGKTIIAPKFGEPKYILEHGKTGFLCESSAESYVNAICEISDNTSIYNSIGNNVKDLFEKKYTHDILVKKIIS